ncbi:UNVERIFIED_CONTAM: hypothetical protein GTU68_009307 [Idotea baltica]|nr:hypothetical protein [Idotea baltica]
MSDAAAPAKSPKKVSKIVKKQPKPTHPPYKNMINAAVKSLKERSGSSRQAILKYIVANYKVGDEKKAGTRLRIALKKGVAAGDIKQMKGSGASGSFRLAKDEKPAKSTPKKAAKKSPAKPKKPVAKKLKKPAAKKPTTPKKPAAKKTKKPAAKKSPGKKPGKKPAAKKAAKK